MKKLVKAGTSKAAAAQRKIDFARAYITNGMNATEAAKTAGCPPKGAHVAGARLLKDAKVKELIAEAAEKSAKVAGLSVDRTLLEVSRLAYSDPRRFYDKNGNLIPLHELDDDTAAAIASIEHEEIWSGRGEDREQTGLLKKLKVWDKNSALEKAMKYHGLYEKDNAQKPAPANVSIHVIGVEPKHRTVHQG